MTRAVQLGAVLHNCHQQLQLPRVGLPKENSHVYQAELTAAYFTTLHQGRPGKGKHLYLAAQVETTGTYLPPPPIHHHLHLPRMGLVFSCPGRTDR